MTEPQPVAVFVGRDRELTELVGGLRDATSGQGRLFLLFGEPGIGKSRLADQLASRARDDGVRVLVGRCWDDAGAPAYWPWMQALRMLIRGTDEAVVRRQLGTGAEDIAQMVPDLRELYPDLPPQRDIESESARFQLFDSTTSFLRRAAQAGPLLIVIDDLHAADTPSILFLRFLGSQLADAAIMVIGTYRDVELMPEAPLTDAVGEIARQPSTRMLGLSGLGEGPVGQFIQSAAGVTPGPRLAAALARETGGNPLFLGESVRLLAAEGRLDEVAASQALQLPVPRGIRDVIARRMRHLPEATVDVLVQAAALGPEFSADVLRRVGDAPSNDLLDRLGEAARAGLITGRGGSPGPVPVRARPHPGDALRQPHPGTPGSAAPPYRRHARDTPRRGARCVPGRARTPLLRGVPRRRRQRRWLRSGGRPRRQVREGGRRPRPPLARVRGGVPAVSDGLGGPRPSRA